MKWMEIILLRTAGTTDQPMSLWKQMATSTPIPGLTEALVYHHSYLPGDFAIILGWETDRALSCGSELALGLVRELSRFGLVDHSTWVASGENLFQEKTARKGGAKHFSVYQK